MKGLTAMRVMSAFVAGILNRKEASASDIAGDRHYALFTLYMLQRVKFHLYRLHLTAISTIGSSLLRRRFHFTNCLGSRSIAYACFRKLLKPQCIRRRL